MSNNLGSLHSRLFDIYQNLAQGGDRSDVFDQMEALRAKITPDSPKEERDIFARYLRLIELRSGGGDWTKALAPQDDEQTDTDSPVNVVIFHRDQTELKKEFPGYEAASNVVPVDVTKLRTVEGPALANRGPGALDSECLGLLALTRRQLSSVFTGVFPIDVTAQSRRYADNTDLNLRDFQFGMLEGKSWDPACLYAASILPAKSKDTPELDALLDSYFAEQGVDISGIAHIPAKAAVVMHTAQFIKVQKSLRHFAGWAGERAGFAAQGLDPDAAARQEAGLLEKAFGYFCALAYPVQNIRRLGEKLDCSNTPFHTICDLTPDRAPEGTYTKTAEHCARLLDMGVLPSDKNDVLLTYTTYGYRTLTDNLIASAKQVGLGDLIIVVCLDRKSLLHYRNMGQPAIYLDGFETPERLDFYEDGWTHLMLAKQVAIWIFLKSGRNVVYIDGDIFFRTDFLENLRSYSRNHPIAYQSDENRFIPYNGRDPNAIRYCAGFGYIKTSNETVQLFEPYLVNLDTYGDDQTYINRLMSRKGTEVMQLPCALYPNGSFWFRNHDRTADRALIVHYNWDKPFFDTPKEQIMSHYGMYGDPDDRADVIRKDPDPQIARFQPPLLINKCIEGWGNKLLSLANTIELAHRHGCKICLDWTEGRYPKYAFSMFLTVQIPDMHRAHGAIRVYEDVEDFCDETRSYYPRVWSHERLLGEVFKVTNVKIPESYMHKVLDEQDVKDLEDFCEFDVSDFAKAGQELDYPNFEKLKFSFKGEAEDLRAPLTWLYGLDKQRFQERLRRKNIVVSDFRYSDTLPHYVRAIQPTGMLKREIEERSSELPGPICGIHIRLTDFFHSKKFDGNYEDLYIRYLEEIRKFGVQNVLVCSDSEDPIAWFAKQDGLSVWNVDLKRSTDGRALHDNVQSDDFDNVRGALLEMGMLSKCDYLIRPKWSSFSTVSQYWGKIPEERVTLID